jgi:hypothetical protein
MTDFVTILAVGNTVVESAILVLLVYWFKFDKRQAKRRPRRPKAPVVVQTIIPKEAVE